MADQEARQKAIQAASHQVRTGSVWIRRAANESQKPSASKPTHSPAAAQQIRKSGR